MSDAIWRTLAQKALGGTVGLESLASQTAEGLPIAPLYARSLADHPPALRQGAGAWAIAQRVDHPDPHEANRLALIDLEGGANALTLVFESGIARGYGLPLNASALATALEGVELDLIALRLDAGDRTEDAVKALARLTTARRLTSAALAVDLGLDPIGSLARTGTARDLAPDILTSLHAASRAAGFAGTTFLADSRPYHEAGAGEAQELAAVLATALAYLRRLEQVGLDLGEARRAIALLLVADADTFLSIAKFRALRRLWARVETACGLTPEPVRLHAETAWRMMTRRDPWVNVMRATAAVFAAGIGGADAVTALPFTAALGLPDDGARRLARNTQLVLLEESHLARVDDPAAGSGGFEALTDSLCASAWALFQQIEREGGIEASLRAGLLQARIAATAARRAASIATLEQGLTGTSTFPPLDTPALALADAARHPEPEPGALALLSARDAAPFESLRDRADAMTAAGGTPPRIYLATLGTPATHGARATYAANFFAAAGIAGDPGAVEVYDPATTPVVCLCGSDALYAEHLTDAVQTLRKAGARRVLLAGRSGAAGLDGLIHQGCNALHVLDETLRFLENARHPRR